MKIKKILSCGMIFLLVVMAVGCGKTDIKTSNNEKLKVYTSFYPIKAFTERVAGDAADVYSFMPEDKEVHDWEPSAKNIKVLSEADVLFINGAGLEPWLDNIKDATKSLEIVDTSEKVEKIEAGHSTEGVMTFTGEITLPEKENKLFFGHTHEKQLTFAILEDNKITKDSLAKLNNGNPTNLAQHSTADITPNQKYTVPMEHLSGEITLRFPKDGKWIFVADHEPGDILPYAFNGAKGDLDFKKIDLPKEENKGAVQYDPHTWLSLKNAQIQVQTIADALAKKDPSHKDIYENNAKNFITELQNMDAEFESKFKAVHKVDFVVPHAAYAYLSRDYHLHQYPLQGLTSIEDPDLKTMQKAVDFCKENHIKTIFFEYQASDKAAQTLAQELGGNVGVKPLATMEFIAKNQDTPQDYLTLMRMNLENILDSLQA